MRGAHAAFLVVFLRLYYHNAVFEAQEKRAGVAQSPAPQAYEAENYPSIFFGGCGLSSRGCSNCSGSSAETSLCLDSTTASIESIAHYVNQQLEVQVWPALPCKGRVLPAMWDSLVPLYDKLFKPSIDAEESRTAVAEVMVARGTQISATALFEAPRERFWEKQARQGRWQSRQGEGKAGRGSSSYTAIRRVAALSAGGSSSSDSQKDSPGSGAAKSGSRAAGRPLGGPGLVDFLASTGCTANHKQPAGKQLSINHQGSPQGGCGTIQSKASLAKGAIAACNVSAGLALLSVGSGKLAGSADFGAGAGHGELRPERDLVDPVGTASYPGSGEDGGERAQSGLCREGPRRGGCDGGRRHRGRIQAPGGDGRVAKISQADDCCLERAEEYCRGADAEVQARRFQDTEARQDERPRYRTEGGAHERRPRRQGFRVGWQIAISAWATAASPWQGSFIGLSTMCEPSKVQQLGADAELYDIEQDDTFVGPVAARLLGCMRAFDLGCEAALGFSVHTLWHDPREETCGLPCPAEYDRALLLAKVHCGLQGSRLPCTPKSQALANPVGYTVGYTFAGPGSRGDLQRCLGQAFHDPGLCMGRQPVDFDAAWAWHRAESPIDSGKSRGVLNELTEGSASSCLKAAACRNHFKRHKLALKVCFAPDELPAHKNRWVRQFLLRAGPTPSSQLADVHAALPLPAGCKAGSCRALASPGPSMPHRPLSQNVQVWPSTSVSPSHVRNSHGTFKRPALPVDLRRPYFVMPAVACDTNSQLMQESPMRPRQMPSTGSPLPSLRLHLSSQIPIYPAELDRPEVRGRMLTEFEWITGHRAAGAVAEGEGQFDRFAVFDTAYHMRVRQLPRGWTLEHLVSELLSLYPRLNGVTFLQDKLGGLPSVQVSVTMRDFAANQAVLPIDFRGFEGRICTIRVTPGLQPDEIRDICRVQCPQDRLPRRPFSVVRSDGQPLEVPQLPARPPDHGVGVARDFLDGEFDPLRLGLRHPGAEDLQDTTSTTTTTIDPDLRTRPVQRPLHLYGVELLPSGVLTAPGAHVPVSQLGIYQHIRREPGGQMHFHMIARGCAPVRLIGTVSWTLLDLCSLAADNLDDRARGMQVITAPIPGLLQPQVTITDQGVSEDYCVLPVDMRCLPGGEVAAVPFRPGMTLQDIFQAILHEIPDCRSSLEPLIATGEVYVQDCNGFVLEQLHGALPAYQWLALRKGCSPFAGALPSCTSTTTTPAAVIAEAPGDSVIAAQARELPLTIPPASVDPPALLTKSHVAADLKLGGVQPIGPQLLPIYLGDARFQRDPVCAFSWGTDDEQQDADLFTVFDVVRHWTVQRRDRHATLPNLIETAVRSAPFGVRSVHILTVPVAGLPRPQMSLGRDTDPVAMWPLPWDLRPVGGDVRTVGHFPGEDVAVFAGKVQQVQPDLPRLKEDIVSGHVAVTDALGFVGNALPLDLEQVQYFQVESHFAARLHVDTSVAIFAGPSLRGGTSTTTTTTDPAARPIGVIYRVVLLWGDCMVQEQIWPPCRQLDGILGRLVRDVFARSPRHPPSHEILVSLAKEQPPLTDGIQEILFFILGPDYDDCPVVVVDERAGGHGLQATRLSRRARCDSLVNPAWRREGVSLVVNGAPENLAQRAADTGDLLQFADLRGRPRSRPLASLFDAFPTLVPYAWPLAIGPRSDQLDVPGTARERRTAQGMWRHKEGACLILGPTHGPVCFRLGEPVVPSRAEAAQGLALLDWRCPAHLTSLHETALIAPSRATFATALPAAPFRTVLIAHMDWPAHQTILLILPTAIVVGPLPIRPRSLCRRPAREWRDGDVISVTEVADAAIPAYEALAAAETPHSIPICPPASASEQDLLAPPVRVPSLTVARADTPVGEHIGWARMPRPRPQRSDDPSSSTGRVWSFLAADGCQTIKD